MFGFWLGGTIHIVSPALPQSIDFGHNFDQTLEPGIDLDPEDLEIGRYSGEELDFEPVLRDLLLLSWPMAPRCAEDCPGLCPVCGENRSRRACQCDAEQANKPFAALGKLLGQSRDESR